MIRTTKAHKPRATRPAKAKSEPILMTLKAELPADLQTEKAFIRDQWRNQPVEPYGRVIAPYGNVYPHNVPHISVRLGVSGVAAFAVVALDEFASPLDVSKLPKRPSYMGTPTLWNHRH